MRFGEQRRRVGLSVDLSEAPLVHITYPSEASEELIEELFALFAELGQDHPRVAYVFDMRRFDPLSASPTMRRVFADAYKRHRGIIERSTICEARVFSNNLIVGVVTAVDWLTGRSYPSKNFLDPEAATQWARKRLDEDTGSIFAAG